MESFEMDKRGMGVFGEVWGEGEDWPLYESIEDLDSHIEWLLDDGFSGNVQGFDDKVAKLGELCAKIREEWRQNLRQGQLQTG